MLEKNEQGQLVSYGGGPDMEASLKDLQNKRWQRLLFVGTTHLIEDGFWINNQEVILVRQFNDTNQEQFKPTLWFVDLGKDIIQYFEYKIHIQKYDL